jgi:hypothetical protein
MPGHVPGIHDLNADTWKTWMAGTSPDKPGHDRSSAINTGLFLPSGSGIGCFGGFLGGSGSVAGRRLGRHGGRLAADDPRRE